MVRYIALEYARLHGLAIDHRSTALELDLASLQKELLACTADGVSPLMDQKPLVDTRLSWLFESDLSKLPDKKFKLSLSASRLLHHVITAPEIDPPVGSSKYWASVLPEYGHHRKLKVSEPLLVSSEGDPTRDLRTIRKGVNLDLMLEHLCNELREETNSDIEALEARENTWLDEIRCAAKTVKRDVKNEKLQIRREVLEWLSMTIRLDSDSRSKLTDHEYTLPRERSEKSERSSTTLTVRDIMDEADQDLHESHIVYCTQVFADVPAVTSKSGDPKREHDGLNVLATALEEGYINKDTRVEAQTLQTAHQTWHPDSLKRPIGHNDTSSYQNESPHKRRKMKDDPKVTVPRVLSLSPIEAKSKIEDEPELKDWFDAEAAARPQIELEPGKGDEFNLSGQTSSSFEEDLVRISDRVAQGNGQDVSFKVSNSYPAITKVDIPSSRPISPSQDTAANNDDDMMLEHIIDQFLPLRIDHVEELDMNWTPFSMTMPEEVLTEDTAGQTEFLRAVTTMSHDIVQSGQLLWNEQRQEIPYSILDETTDTELGSDAVQDICTLPAHECKALSISQPERSNPSSPHDGERLRMTEDIKGTQPEARSTTYENAESKSGRPESISVFTKPTLATKTLQSATPAFSASASVMSFLNLRGKRFKKPPVNKTDHIASELADDPIQPTQDSQVADNQITPQLPVTISQPCRGHACTLETLTSLLPSTETLDESTTIVVNSSLVQSHHGLTSFLENKAGSTLIIIYRDFRDGIEAAPDIIISPSKCIMYTNIQCLTQRSLPGQNQSDTLSPTHQRVSKLAANFDSALILVVYNQEFDSDQQVITMNNIAEFAAFCASLSTSVVVVRPVWLPNVDPIALINAWTWSIISHSAVTDWSQNLKPEIIKNRISFIQDETLWELFLRRAGLNPMAAQIVLSMLQKPSKVNDVCSNDEADVQNVSWGLSYFVRMLPEERKDIFGQILGFRCVQAINRVLESNMAPGCQKIYIQ